MTASAPARLVLVDGLPGTGKSSMAHLLCLHLQRHGRAARWYWEIESPHPVFEFQDNLVDDRLRDGFPETAIQSWERVAADVRNSKQSLILESSFLQTPIHPTLLSGWDEERIAAFVQDVEQAMEGACPLLVLLRLNDVVAGLDEIAAVRGEWFLRSLEERICPTPYGRALGLTGTAGVARYLQAYQEITDRLLARLRIPVVVCDAPSFRYDSLDERVVAALRLPPFTAFETRIRDLRAFTGRYHQPGSDNACSVVTDGRHLFLEGTPRARLIQCGETTFAALGTCVQFHFVTDASGGVQGLECQGNFPDLIRDWVKSS
jgi:hypothetical protein